MPVPSSSISTFVTMPRHHQDTSIHCGHACAMMMVDRVGKGKSYQPGGTSGLKDISQVMMHLSASPDPIESLSGSWACTPSELRNLINNGDSPPATVTVAREVPAAGSTAAKTGTEITNMADRSVQDDRPAVVLQSRSSGGGSHWVVVHGRSRTPAGKTNGFYLLNPWVPSKEWAYTDCSGDDPDIPCLEAVPPSARKDVGKNYFCHKRGESCKCPNWKVDGPAIDGEWVARANFITHVNNAKRKVPASSPAKYQCHAVLYGTANQLNADINP